MRTISMTRLYLLMIAFLLSSNFAYAGNTGLVRVVSYKVSSIGTIVYINTDITNVAEGGNTKPACITSSTNSIKSIFIDRADASTYIDFFSTIMLALANDRDVAFWLNQDANCNLNQGGPHAIATVVYLN